MSERVPAQNKTSVTPPQAIQSSSPLLRRSLTEEVSESVGSHSNISKEVRGIQPKTIRRSLNWQNITVEAPHRSASSTFSGGIQRLETSDVKEQEESKEQQNKELVQTQLTVGAPGDQYEQEADSMAAKVMTMPDSALQPPIQRQTDEEIEAVQMQPLVNSITPVVQRSSGEGQEIKKATGEKKNPYDHLDEHALVNMADAERAKVFEEEAKQGIYRGAKVINKDKSIDFELDRVNTKEEVIIEDKIAKGFEKNHYPEKAMQAWAEKQIYKKTKNKIEFLKNQAESVSHDPKSKSSSPFTPPIEQVKNIKSFEFRLQVQRSSLNSELMEVLRAEISKAIEALKAEFPDWKFDVVFGD